MLPICGITIVALCLIIMYLVTELSKEKIKGPEKCKDPDHGWREGWQARKWYERGAKQKTASPK